MIATNVNFVNGLVPGAYLRLGQLGVSFYSDCLYVMCHFLCFITLILIVSIPDLCTLTYFDYIAVWCYIEYVK